MWALMAHKTTNFPETKCNSIRTPCKTVWILSMLISFLEKNNKILLIAFNPNSDALTVLKFFDSSRSWSKKNTFESSKLIYFALLRITLISLFTAETMILVGLEHAFYQNSVFLHLLPPLLKAIYTYLFRRNGMQLTERSSVGGYRRSVLFRREQQL
uniref:Uncharacterized protein n=1 Tax=Romanomermis culicivorax TaxID=13658 RepID=A0A915LCL9_ROMCU